MNRRILPALPLILLGLTLLRAQEGSMTISVSTGASFLSFTSVDDDGRRDIRAFNNQGIPIGDYDPLDVSLVHEGDLEFRIDRDVALRLFGASMTATTGAALRDSVTRLSLDREISSTDFGVDLLYFLPPLVYDMEVGLFVGLGRMSGRATQTTFQEHTQKSADTTVVITDQDAFSSYKKSKIYVRAGARFSWMFAPPVSFHVNAAYKYAPLGMLDGTLREFSLIRPHTTTVEFDYSAIDVRFGIAYTL